MIQAIDTFETTIQIAPIGKGRPKFSSRGRFVIAYTPKKTRDFETEFANNYRRRVK